MRNQPRTANLLVITSYPEKGKIHGRGTVGIASYTKNTLLSLLKAAKKKRRNPKIVVLAEQLEGNRSTTYKEDGLEVRRVWKRNSFFTYFSLLKEVFHFWQTKTILFEFEMSMFGHYLVLIFLPLFFLILKILGKETIFVSHQVIDDINLLSGHIGLETNSTKADVINILIYLFYKFTFVSVSKIIVFEEYLKQKLGKFTSREKIIVIPHGVERFEQTITKQEARKRLETNNECVILYFGFIAWYKGTDWIVERIQNSEFRIQNKKIKLIIAGGANPNHEDKNYYLDYVKEVEDKARVNGKILVTGFVEEKKIPLYFSACDLVVLPYRTLMSSSGPLSLALSFRKPFLISEPMKGIVRTKDFNETMSECNMKIEDMTFSLIGDSFEKRLNKLITDKEYLRKLLTLSRLLKRKRNFENIGKQYYQEIFL